MLKKAVVEVMVGVGILAEDFELVLGDFDTLEDWNKVILA
jgi:hypothetical protein